VNAGARKVPAPLFPPSRYMIICTDGGGTRIL